MRSMPLVRFVTLFALVAVVPLAATSFARAESAPADVGAYLQAGAALKLAFAGRHGVVHQNVPGCIDGLELRPERSKPFDAGRLRNRVHDDGLAYATDDSVIITTVLLSRHEITILLGIGGYDPSHLNDSPDRIFPGRQYYLEWQIAWLNQAAGTPTDVSGQWSLTQLTKEAAETRRRELENQRGELIKAREDAEANSLQMARQRIARVSGARIRLLYEHDIPLRDLDERSLRTLLEPYLSLAD